MSKGGGSSTTNTQQLPAWLEDAAKSNLARAGYASQLGYMPYYGNDVAAFSPMQNQAFQQTGAAAQAFGMAPQGFDPLAGMPQATTDAQGFSGYSSGNMFDTAMSELQQRRPAQYDAYNSMFINPQTGAAPNVAFTPSGSVALSGSGVGAQGAANYTESGLQDMASSYDYGQMGAGAENFWLGLATSDIPVLYGLGNMVAGNIIDNRMDAIENQIDTTWDNSQQGILTAIDSSGNVSSTYSPSTWDSPSTSDAPSWDSTGNVYDGGGWSSADNAVTTSGSTVFAPAPSPAGGGYYSSDTSGSSSSDSVSYGNDYSSSTGSNFDPSDFTSDYGGGLSGDTATIGSSDSGSSSSDSSGTYCCTAMRKNGDWESHIKVYRMHKWHFDQPQWWRDGYDVWGKIIADKLITKKGNYWSKCFNAFYDKHVRGGKSTIKSAVAEVIMYPAVFTIGMARKLTGKHVELVEVGE